MNKPMPVGPALEIGVSRLAAAGVQTSRLDARLLMSVATDLSVERIVAYPERILSVAECEHFETLVARRLAREPMAQILGRREFWSLSFKVTADTLTPRPETETLVDAALSIIEDCAAEMRILDLGSGTGCLLLALLSELPAARGVGVDRSAEVVHISRENAARLDLASRASFVVGDWDSPVEGRFDLIVSNPPYIPDTDLAELEPEVRLYEPVVALSGGADGLDCYRALAPILARRTSPYGAAILEVGAGQADAVAAIMVQAGLAEKARRMDLAGIERCLIMCPDAGKEALMGEAKQSL